jgi:cyclophilin family peptidyl-prolyl cis-trans isomerase/HEAT repeat protein
VTRKSIFILALVVCIACSDKKNRFEDETEATIADLQDRRNGDSLKIFLSSDNARYRKEAELAFASVQDSTAIAELAKINDPEAAFALGQMYNHQAVTNLIPKLSDKSENTRNEALEALGKVIAKKDLSIFTDSMDAEGLAWAYYRAGLRNITDSISTFRSASILGSANTSRLARLGAAHFFSRSQFKSIPGVAALLTAASQEENDDEVRMAVVNALSKLKPEESLEAIKSATSDPDYRVRVNSARALRTQPWDVAKPLFEKLLNDENVQVNVAAAEVFANVAKDTATLHTWAKAAKNWRTQATLYSKLKGVEKEVKAIYAGSSNDYQKAALLSALSSHWNNSGFVFEQFKATKSKVIKSSSASVLVQIDKTGTMPKFAETKEAYLMVYRYLIKDGDVGAISAACNALRDSTLGYKKIITDYSFLEEAKSKLSLPRDYETYAPLEETLNYLKGLPPPEPLKNKFNHPIDWKLAASIDKDQRVLIKTSKGDITMQLFIEEAPGSVVNFVNLVNSGYFNGKFFHRVVPNFVIQTGCNRGDGFGSEDYSIRSEFSQRKYKTGSVGMASAGKDTEGTQWFITHSPTPHLDGKYTIFAEVVSGMEVVHQIEVGDQIIEARLIKD